MPLVTGVTRSVTTTPSASLFCDDQGHEGQAEVTWRCLCEKPLIQTLRRAVGRKKIIEGTSKFPLNCLDADGR
jgi:hypothetical protein